MKIFLIGFMGAGKTTTGRKLAKSMNYGFLDSDVLIEEQEKMPIAQIFSEKGENYFREAERGVLKKIVAINADLVVSTGGGAPCYSDNMSMMNDSGITVYLKLPPGLLYQRLLRSYRKDRPLIRDKSPHELLQYITDKLNEREVYYNRSRIVLSAEFIYLQRLKKTIQNIIQDL